MTGVILLSFMIIHLLQFRFGETSTYDLRPPPYLIYFMGILKLQLFWTSDTDIATVGVRDIYKLEFDQFTSASNPFFPQSWAVFYLFSTGIFVTHGCMGWKKCIPVLGIPKKHQSRVAIIGYGIFVVLGLIYVSFPAWCMYLGHGECGKTFATNATNSPNLNLGDYYSVTCP